MFKATNTGLVSTPCSCLDRGVTINPRNIDDLCTVAKEEMSDTVVSGFSSRLNSGITLNSPESVDVSTSLEKMNNGIGSIRYRHDKYQ